MQPQFVPAVPHAPSRMLYDAAFVPAAWLGFRIAGLVDAKAREGLRGRRDQWTRLEAEAEKLRGAVWFHAASVGEYEQARPVLRALREERPDLPTLQTVFSPSGWSFARKRLDADHLEYLPLDTSGAMRRMVALVRPRAVVFLKFDVWPNLVWATRQANVPLLLLDATLHRKSHRLSRPARGFFGRLFDCFSCIGAISEDDATRFREGLRCRAPITVTGDTRTDQVVHRWREAADSLLARALAAAPFTYLTLGSVWPADTAVVLEAALDAVGGASDRGLVAVPHEPTEDHLRPLEDAIRQAGLTPTRLSELFDLESRAPRVDPATESGRWRVVVVDTIGVLAEIYRGTDLTYVGGSFSTGVHNVLEPAVAHQPVVFGPRIHNAYEAERLVEVGGGFVVETAEEARESFVRLFSDPSKRDRAAEAAQSFVLGQSGATEASLQLVRSVIAGKEP